MPKKANPIKRLFNTIFRTVPANLFEQYKAHCLEVNAQRMFVLAIYVIVLQIVLQIINILKPADTTGSNIIFYVILSLGTLTIGITYAILFSLIRRKKITSVSFTQFAIQSFLYLYVCIQLVFCTLNIMSDGGTESYYIAILLVGLVPTLNHRQGLLTILGAFAYVIGVYVFIPSMSSAWDSIMLTDVWANLIIITALTCCVSVFTNNLFISNFVQGVELSAYNKKLELMATTDELTGMQNRHNLSIKLDFLWHLSVRNKHKIALAMFDIDFFKSYNDTFGHPAGDECIKKVAETLLVSFRRKDDIVCRYGGEEFLVVIGADDNLFEYMDTARKNVEALRIPHAKTTVSPYVTISGGMCIVVPSLKFTVEQAIKAADDALYSSKESGRNRITQIILDE
jgi:diguanylate cyclase (GGDEF)-like protein